MLYFNQQNYKYIVIFCIIFLLFGIYFISDKLLAISFLKQPEIKHQNKNSTVLYKLLSPKELKRFHVIEKVKKMIDSISLKEIETIILSNKNINVSTLIFVLMEKKRSDIYYLEAKTLSVLEQNIGAFPNICYYYARITPQKGIRNLIRLYNNNLNERMFICRALGEIATKEAFSFLLDEAIKQKKDKKNIYSQLAGLLTTQKKIPIDKLNWLLDQELDREEIIILSKFKCNLNQNHIMSLYFKGKLKKYFAIEYIFRDLKKNFSAMKKIIEEELNNNHIDFVMKIMTSDKISRCKDQELNNYRKTIINRIKKKKIKP